MLSSKASITARPRPTMAARKNLFRYSVCSIVLIALLIDGVQSQFFTKSSSKSIPRMGRRSLPDYPNALEAYQQLLAEEYNESLMNRNDNLDVSKSIGIGGGGGGRDSVGGGIVSATSGGRLAELLRTRERVVDDDYAPNMSRDERSDGAFYSGR